MPPIVGLIFTIQGIVYGVGYFLKWVCIEFLIKRVFPGLYSAIQEYRTKEYSYKEVKDIVDEGISIYQEMHHLQEVWNQKHNKQKHNDQNVAKSLDNNYSTPSPITYTGGSQVGPKTHKHQWFFDLVKNKSESTRLEEIRDNKIYDTNGSLIVNYPYKIMVNGKEKSLSKEQLEKKYKKLNEKYLGFNKKDQWFLEHVHDKPYQVRFFEILHNVVYNDVGQVIAKDNDKVKVTKNGHEVEISLKEYQKLNLKYLSWELEKFAHKKWIMPESKLKRWKEFKDKYFKLKAYLDLKTENVPLTWANREEKRKTLEGQSHFLNFDQLQSAYERNMQSFGKEQQRLLGEKRKAEGINPEATAEQVSEFKSRLENKSKPSLGKWFLLKIEQLITLCVARTPGRLFMVASGIYGLVGVFNAEVFDVMDFLWVGIPLFGVVLSYILQYEFETYKNRKEKNFYKDAMVRDQYIETFREFEKLYNQLSAAEKKVVMEMDYKAFGRDLKIFPHKFFKEQHQQNVIGEEVWGAKLQRAGDNVAKSKLPQKEKEAYKRFLDEYEDVHKKVILGNLLYFPEDGLGTLPSLIDPHTFQPVIFAMQYSDKVGHFDMNSMTKVVDFLSKGATIINLIDLAGMYPVFVDMSNTEEKKYAKTAEKIQSMTMGSIEDLPPHISLVDLKNKTKALGGLVAAIKEAKPGLSQEPKSESFGSISKSEENPEELKRKIEEKQQQVPFKKERSFGQKVRRFFSDRAKANLDIAIDRGLVRPVEELFLSDIAHDENAQATPILHNFEGEKKFEDNKAVLYNKYKSKQQQVRKTLAEHGLPSAAIDSPSINMLERSITDNRRQWQQT